MGGDIKPENQGQAPGAPRGVHFCSSEYTVLWSLVGGGGWWVPVDVESVGQIWEDMMANFMCQLDIR